MSTSSNQCQICLNEGQIVPFPYPSEYSLWRCQKCHTIFMSPEEQNRGITFVEQSLKKEVDLIYWSIPHFFNRHRDLFLKYFSKRLRILKSFSCDSIFRTLDIGCGHGFWANYLVEQGHQVVGIDIAAEACENCRSSGLEVYQQNLEQYFLSHPQSRFNLISACDVLEHVDDPYAFLQQCSSLLEKGGLLYLQVPDVFGMRFPLGHDPLLPHHRWHFKYRSLQILLRRLDFTIVSHQTGILGVVGECEKRGVVPRWLAAKWWLYSMLRIGNRLQLVCQKI